MKKSRRIFIVLALAALVLSALCAPAFAITEHEVEAQIAATSKAAVTGNLLLWFLCAVAFLKVSQKIDSILASLGVNVGRTGGSLLAEAMIAMRTITTVIGGGRKAGAGGAGAAAGKSGSSGMAGFFKGGLIGMAGRHITNSAVKTATSQTSAVHTAQSKVHQAAAANTAAQNSTHISSEVHTGGSSGHTGNGVPAGVPPQEGVILTGSGAPSPAPQASPAPQTVGAPVEGTPDDMSPPQEGVILAGGENTVHAPQTENIFSGGTEGTVHTENTSTASGERRTDTHTERSSQTAHTTSSSERVQTNRFQAGKTVQPTLGGMVFSRSLAAGGSFANDVIGTVARGEVAGSITGDMAIQSLSSYMGCTSPGAEGREAPVYSDVEIGRGRITGVETAAGAKEGISFAMYHMEQYTAPAGEYTKVVSADGTQWYKQYAQDAVERKPYMAPDDTVAYHERIIKKLPDPPKRKDRI